MQRDRSSLLARALTTVSPTRFISDDRRTIAFPELGRVSRLSVSPERLRGRTVLLSTKQQLPTVLALLALDGTARRILLATPDLHTHLPAIIAEARVEHVLTDADEEPLGRLADHATGLGCQAPDPGPDDCATEWVLFTSGTTTRPKMAVHTLSSLAGPLHDGVVRQDAAVWSTFYDIRRYGGLQILLRALLGDGSLILSEADETVGAFLRRLANAQLTHISGTPSHWRKALMNDAGSIITPDYIRLSGEIADQPILDGLRRAFPNAASIVHAFASTEAGVAFDVRDGLAGFPASLLTAGAAEIRIVGGTLRIRSSRTASRYIGQPLPKPDGFIDTGDLVEQRGERFYFTGRKEGVINVGGFKVFPEEVETVLNGHPDVRMARVWPRKNPITGAVVAAEVVVGPNFERGFGELRNELSRMCRASLAPYKVPATWRKVDAIETTAAGKVRRA